MCRFRQRPQRPGASDDSLDPTLIVAQSMHIDCRQDLPSRAGRWVSCNTIKARWATVPSDSRRSE